MVNAVDAYTSVGQTHLVCEDYFRVGPNYVILSDGCSGVADADCGARWLALAVQQEIELAGSNPELLVNRAVHRAVSGADLSGLGRSCLHATLVLAAHCGHYIRTLCVGDGLVAGRLRPYSTGDVSAMWEIVQYEYPNQTPYYPLYSVCDPHIHLMGYVPPPEEDLVKSRFLLLGDGPTAMEDVCSTKYYGHRLDVGVETWHTSKYDRVAVFTDGLMSFYREVQTETSKSREPVGWQEVLPELLNTKSTSRGFVQRRCKKALAGLKHYDDFSMGMLALVEK